MDFYIDYFSNPNPIVAKFDEMYKRDTPPSYGEVAALVEHLIANDQWKLAVKLFGDLSTWSLTPTVQLYTLMLQNAVQWGDGRILYKIFEGTEILKLLISPLTLIYRYDRN
jgi:hypothetical protein